MRAFTTPDGSSLSSMLISASFLTRLARLPNSSAQRVSSRSFAKDEQVMMRHVFELPPKLSARRRVSMESR